MRSFLKAVSLVLVLTGVILYRPVTPPGTADPRFGFIALDAQTLASSTTLSAAITSDATVMTVASATGFTAGNRALIDLEVVVITSVSGTTIGISRGRGGVRASAHASGNTVYTGGAQHFYSRDPDINAACTRGSASQMNDNATYLPWINDQTGTVWNCRQTNVWWGTTRAPITYNSLQTATG